ncbi:hypothetical protein IT570_01155 [Candidatus Sumerlaeota bacterium]|nr:hypothetical protein [Candidatus Sumerlaeota bacterium]
MIPYGRTARNSAVRHFFSPLALLILGYAALLAARGKVWNGEGIDECYYYAHLTSPLLDRDLNFANDFLLSRNDYDTRLALSNRLHGEVDNIVRPDVPFACGMAVLSAPAFCVASLVPGGSQSMRFDRFAYPFRAAFTLTTWLAVLLGLVSCQRIASRFTSEAWSAMLAGALFLGTNLCYYTWVAPAMSHGASFGIGALFLLSVLRYREAPSQRNALVAGALAGLCFLVRWQDAVLFLAFVVAWMRTARRPSDLAIAIVAGTFTALPQFLVWRQLYGSLFAIPQGAGFFIAEWWRPFAVLFSPLNGWISTHPLIALFLAAFVVLRRDSIVAICLAVLAAELFVNSLAGDWWAGGSFGNRRFVSIYAFLIPAAAIASARTTRAGRIFAATFAGGCVIVNLLLVIRFTHQATLPVFWGGFAARLSDYLQLATHSRDAILSSDLFSPPIAVDGSRRVNGIMAILLSTVIMTGWYAVTILRRRISPHAAIAPVGLMLWSLVCSWSFGTATGYGSAKRNIPSWQVIAADAIRDSDRTELRRLAAEHPHESPTIYQVESAITQKRWDDATTLTRTIARDFPKLVGDAWQRTAPMHRAERKEWVDLIDGQGDPSRETLERLYGEASILRDAARAKAIRTRLHGPVWYRDMLRFREEYDSGQDAGKLRARCTSALDANPFHSPALQELLRLDRNAPDVDALTARHHRAAREAIELAEYVHANLPGIEVAFEHLWRGAFIEQFQCLEWRGVARAGAVQLARAKDLAMRERELAYWEKRLATAALFEKRMMVREPQPPPDAVEAPPLLFPEGAIARATPQWLRYEDGWGGFETNKATGESWRWSMYPTVFVPLDHSLTAGEYTVRLRGRRLDLGDKQPNVKFDFYGDSSQQRAALYDETFDLSIPLTLSQGLAAPIIRMNHATYPVSEHFAASEDTRRVGLIFYQMWVERDETNP